MRKGGGREREKEREKETDRERERERARSLRNGSRPKMCGRWVIVGRQRTKGG